MTTGRNIGPAIAAAVACMMMAGPVSAQSTVECSAENNAQAKDLFERGQAHNKLGEHGDAAREYLRAYELCPRPFLLFNAAQMLWLAGERGAALEHYAQHIEAEPDSTTADVARERFYEHAAELDKQGETEPAEGLYARYLQLAPGGEHVARAKARLEALAAEREAAEKAERERLEAEKAEAERRKAEQAAEAEKARQAELTAGGSGGDRKLNRIGFWSMSGLAAVGGGMFLVTMAQVNGLNDDKNAARDRYQSDPNVPAADRQLAQDDICSSSQLDNPTGNADLLTIKDACDRGPGKAMLGNIAGGVFWVSAAAAGYFLYKGYLQKAPGDSRERATLITPVVGRDTVGASMTLSF